MLTQESADSLLSKGDVLQTLPMVGRRVAGYDRRLGSSNRLRVTMSCAFAARRERAFHRSKPLDAMLKPPHMPRKRREFSIRADVSADPSGEQGRSLPPPAPPASLSPFRFWKIGRTGLDGGGYACLFFLRYLVITGALAANRPGEDRRQRQPPVCRLWFRGASESHRVFLPCESV